MTTSRRTRTTGAIIAAAALATAFLAVAPAQESEAVTIRRAPAPPPSTTYAVIKTIDVGANPLNVAVNDLDDTVYVTHVDSRILTIIDGVSGVVDDSISLDDTAYAVAVNQEDDTVYVSSEFDDTLSVINGSTLDVVGVSAGTDQRGVAVDQDDDTVYVTNFTSNSLTIINGRTLADDTTAVGNRPWGVAVDADDDSVYVMNSGLPSSIPPSDLSIINGRTLASQTISLPYKFEVVAVNEADDTIYVTGPDAGVVSVLNPRTGSIGLIIPGPGPAGVAVDQNDDTVYVTNSRLYNVTIIDGRTDSVTDTITVGSSPIGVAVDDSGLNSGLAYVAVSDDSQVSVIGRVAPTVEPTPPYRPASQVEVLVEVLNDTRHPPVDDSVVQSIEFGTFTGTGLGKVAESRWAATPDPAGTGTVPVTVTFLGGLTATAGTHTYSPTPEPVTYPPGPPSIVAATAADASALVSWTAPSDPGSYPVTDYQVTASPGGSTCLVPAPTVSCEVTGLTNGKPYTFTARALNGAGWGAYSAPSSAVTPESPVSAALLISGTRGEVRGKPGVIVTGTSTGFGMGAILRPWTRFPGQSAYTEGSASILVDTAGTFTWERRTGKKIYVYVKTPDGTVKSNTVTITTQ